MVKYLRNTPPVSLKKAPENTQKARVRNLWTSAKIMQKLRNGCANEQEEQKERTYCSYISVWDVFISLITLKSSWKNFVFSVC